jgi:hypothetical protein
MLLALAIAPQRTTLYGNLARFLAPSEVFASPLGGRVRAWERRRLAGQDYLLLELDGDLAADELDLLARLGAVASAHEFFEAVGPVPGPLLRPLEPEWGPFLPLELVEARRYRGKTSELFSAFLLNLALFAGTFAERSGERLRVLDPLAGGGTGLFSALVRGYDAVGIEREREDVESTDTYVRQFLREIGIPFKRVDERVRGAGRRFVFSIGRADATRTLGLILGDTFQAPHLLAGLPGGARFHAITADLPYGIQHRGQVADLLERALPLWAATLLPGGALALAWEASHLIREEATAIVEQHGGLQVLDAPPYDALEHPVDRQIKRRDVLVVRKHS